MINSGLDNVRRLLKAGRKATDEKDFDEASKSYLKLLNLCSNSVNSIPEAKKRDVLNEKISDVYNGMAYLLHKMGKQAEAMSLYEKTLLHANTPDAMARINRGMSSVFIALGDYGGAKEVFKNYKLYSVEMLPRELELFKGQHRGLPVDKCLKEIEEIKKSL